MRRAAAPGRQRQFVSAGGVVREISEQTGVLLNGDAAFNPQLSEVEEAKWFSPSGARRAISFKKSRETLDAAIADLEAGQVAS